GRPLGAELLEPTRLYTGVCLELAAGLPVHAFSHVTGGGLAANLARVLPAGLNAVVDRGTWALPTVMAVLARAGQVPGPDLEQTFNLGVGMVAVLPADAASRAVDTCERAGIPAWVCGHVTTDDMPDAIRGAKGVDGGGVLLAGQFQ
ncbi:MAG: phosphoribosylformylglycinamidine cyclo-ligase, partial [Micrococcales bacterium]